MITDYGKMDRYELAAARTKADCPKVQAQIEKHSGG